MTHILKPLSIALKGKGLTSFLKRVWTLGRRYGLTVAKMDHALEQLSKVLQQFDAGATFPITATALADKGDIIQKYQAQGIEFAVHGYRHVDHSQLSLAEQKMHFEKASQIFLQQGIQFGGFRSPYLRFNEHTLAALAQSGFSYDSTPGLFWDIGQKHITESYLRVLDFYGAQSANDYPALPYLGEVNNLVRIPYCLPDDEALIERLKLIDKQTMSNIWMSILNQTYELGELFTLGLHPERISLLHQPLSNTLARARELSPKVWIARLDEIAHWWRARSQATFELKVENDNHFQLSVSGPPGITVLARDVAINAKIESWYGGFDRILETSFSFQAGKRPCIGLSPDSAPALSDFLKQQGYWVETGHQSRAYSIYMEQAHFTPEDERPLLRKLAQSEASLIRLGRWPNGAQSAMCVTGDIDALTLWDYLLRFLGK